MKAMSMAACAMLLAACNRTPSINEKNASVDDVAAKVREASSSGSFIRPGQWQSNVTIEAFDIPGMPAEAVQHMKSAVAQNQQHDFKSCLTTADVKQPKSKFFTGNDQCRYEHFTMGGGRIDAAMRCPGGQGPSQMMTLTGAYSPDRYTMRMTMKGEGMPGPASGMTMRMRVDSKRIGECSAEATGGKPAARPGN